MTANRVFSTVGCTQFSSTATLSSTGGPVCIAGPLAAIQAINERGSTGYSNYNSLQVRYTKRFSRGLEALLVLHLVEGNRRSCTCSFPC